MSIDKKLLAETSYWRLFKKNVWSGFAWAIGVTVGFAFISTVVVLILGMLGGVPLIGGFIATIVEATNSALLNRSPIGQ